MLFERGQIGVPGGARAERPRGEALRVHSSPIDFYVEYSKEKEATDSEEEDEDKKEEDKDAGDEPKIEEVGEEKENEEKHSEFIGWHLQNGRVEITLTDQGNRITPSYVAFTNEERLIGDNQTFANLIRCDASYRPSVQGFNGADRHQTAAVQDC